MPQESLDIIKQQLDIAIKTWSAQDQLTFPQQIIVLFHKALSEHASEYYNLANKLPQQVDAIYSTAIHYSGTNSQETHALAQDISKFVFLKTLLSDTIHHTPVAEEKFIEYLSRLTPKDKLLSEAVALATLANDLRWEDRLNEFSTKSELFSNSKEAIEKLITDLSKETKKYTDNLLTKQDERTKEFIQTIHDKLEVEQRTATSILEQYEQISKAALKELSSSFSGFKKTKKDEMDGWLKRTTYLGIFALLIAFIGILVHPASQFAIQFDNWKDFATSFSNSFSGSLLYVIIFEALIIYFFRISLTNYYAARDELLQLEIREALCEFAPTYKAFATTEGGQLEEFAKHVFSPLASKINPTPHPLDFLGQFCNVVNNGKKK